MLLSSSLVNVTDDAEIRLVSLLAESAQSPAQFQSSCESCISEGDIEGLVRSIMQDEVALQTFSQLNSEEEAVGAFSIFVALVERLGSNSNIDLADIIVKSNPTSSNESRQRAVVLLSVIYNMKSDPVQKCNLLNQMYQVAGPELLAPDRPLGRLLEDELVSIKGNHELALLPRLVVVLDTWKNVVGLAQRRQLFQTIVAALLKQDQRHLRFLLLLVESYQGDTIDSAGKDAATKAALGAIQSPFNSMDQQRNLLQLDAIQAIEPTLLDLLKIFQEGMLVDYQNFIQSNKSILEKYQLDEKECEKNIKILTLCSLAANQEEIPYATIADALQLSETEVESWVIAAVGSGLLKAKMDQLASKVVVEKCTIRKFDMPQWKALQAKLQSYKQSIRDILETLKSSN